MQNHFQLFGLPADFAVDMVLLGERYRDLQRQFHPDRFATASVQEQREAIEKASLINEAYRALKSPVQRGAHLLALAGREVDFERNTAMSPAFLMAQMEWREQLEEVASAEGAGALRKALIGEMNGLSEAFVSSLGGGDLDAAAARLAEMQFFQKLLGEVDRLEERFDEA